MIPTKYQNKAAVNEDSGIKPFPIDVGTGSDDEEASDIQPDGRRVVYPAAPMQWSYHPTTSDYSYPVMYSPVPFMRPEIAVSKVSKCGSV